MLASEVQLHANKSRSISINTLTRIHLLRLLGIKIICHHKIVITKVGIMLLDNLTGQLSFADAFLLIFSTCVAATAQSPTGTHGAANVLKRENYYVVFEASSL